MWTTVHWSTNVSGEYRMKGSTEQMMAQSRRANTKSKTATKSKAKAANRTKRTSINNVHHSNPTKSLLCGTARKPCVAHETIGTRPFTADDFSPSKRNDTGRSSWCKYCCRASYAADTAKRAARKKEIGAKGYAAIEPREFSIPWHTSMAAKFFKHCNTLTRDYDHAYTSFLS